MALDWPHEANPNHSPKAGGRDLPPIIPLHALHWYGYLSAHLEDTASPMFSQNFRRDETLSFFGSSGQPSCSLAASPTLVFLENRHTNTPTPPAASFCLARI